MTERYKGWSILITKVEKEHREMWEYDAVRDGKKIRGAEYDSELSARMGARSAIDNL
jgi:hypothetical protein